MSQNQRVSEQRSGGEGRTCSAKRAKDTQPVGGAAVVAKRTLTPTELVAARTSAYLTAWY
jgi:hypothetical protein